MKTNKLYSGIILLVFFSVIPLTRLQAETNVQNITLQREGEYTNVAIYADAPLQFNHFIQEKKDGKPYRVVIDCLNAVNSLPQKNFQDLPQGIISSIRTSQYQTTPEKVCRIVLDLKNPVVYKVVKGTEEKNVTFAFSTPQEPAFQTWSATQRKSSKEDVKLTEAAGTQPAQDKAQTVQKEVSQTKKDKADPSLDNLAKKEQKVVLAATGLPQAQKTDVKPAEKAKTPEKPSPQVQKETKPAVPVEKPKTPEPKKVQADSMKVVKADTLKKEAPAKVPGKVMEETPKRELLVFHTGERKDPFSPLTDKKNFELGSVPLPNFEELKLVGILEDNIGFKALLENDLGYGYILEAGDRIKNGSVVSVDKERVIFQIREYGYAKNIALELYTPNQEER